MTTKQEIANFNANKNKNDFFAIMNKYVTNHTRCKDCGGAVYYYDSIFRINKMGNVYPDKRSFLTKKSVLDIDYNLCVCEECLSKKFPEYQTLNKAKDFNRICDITCYAFNIPAEVSEEWKKNNYAITLETLQKKHGNEVGAAKWKEYCDKQAKSNTYEYKKEKYGWSKEQFKEYNKSRSVTRENLIARHGEDAGLKKWDNYCKRQRHTCSLEYFTKKHGKVEGLKIFANFAQQRAFAGGYSNISQAFFDVLDCKLNYEYSLQYATKNSERCVVNDVNGTSYSLDCYIPELNLGIEFNGDAWHANPKIYKETDVPIPSNLNRNSGYCAKTVWERDKTRNDYLKTKLTDVLVVWESEIKENGIDETADALVEKIRTYKK